MRQPMKDKIMNEPLLMVAYQIGLQKGRSNEQIMEEMLLFMIDVKNSIQAKELDRISNEIMMCGEDKGGKFFVRGTKEYTHEDVEVFEKGHECRYSKSMDQKYPRLCTICQEPEKRPISNSKKG